MTTSKNVTELQPRMTREQLADLSTLAAQLQAKAEASDDRDIAVMAFAVQKVCAELIESRYEFKLQLSVTKETQPTPLRW